MPKCVNGKKKKEGEKEETHHYKGNLDAKGQSS